MRDEEKRNQLWGGWAIAIIIGVIVLTLLFGGGGMMGRYGYSVSPWWGLAMMLFWVVLLAGGVFLVVWLLRQSRLTDIGFQRGPRPLEILQQRYAKGELTREQYEQMRRDLTEQP